MSVDVLVGVGVSVAVSSSAPGTATVASPLGGGSPTLVPGVNGSFSPGTGGGRTGVAVRFSYARSSFT